MGTQQCSGEVNSDGNLRLNREGNIVCGHMVVKNKKEKINLTLEPKDFTLTTQRIKQKKNSALLWHVIGRIQKYSRAR